MFDNKTNLKQAKPKQENGSFGGLNKGFLFGGKPSTKKEKPMTHIKAQPENSSLKFKEVEDAQRKPNWITDSLLG